MDRINVDLSTLLALSIGGGMPPPRHHLSDATQVRCSGAKPGSSRSPSYLICCLNQDVDYSTGLGAGRGVAKSQFFRFMMTGFMLLMW